MKLELIRSFYGVNGLPLNEWEDEDSIKRYGYEYNGYIIAEKHTNENGHRYTSKEFRCYDEGTVKELYNTLQQLADKDTEIADLRAKNAAQIDDLEMLAWQNKRLRQLLSRT